jgi:hypothetical protein
MAVSCKGCGLFYFGIRSANDEVESDFESFFRVHNNYINCPPDNLCSNNYFYNPRRRFYEVYSIKNRC